jgi:excisionase family DNA binding protein
LDLVYDRNKFAGRKPNMDEILTVPQVARYLKISRSKAYYLVQQKKIPYIRIGRNVRVREADLEKWIESNLIVNGQIRLLLYGND